MKNVSNWQRARSNIVFILGLLAATALILVVENSHYATLGAQPTDGTSAPGNWVVKIGSISTAEQAQKICRAARDVDVACFPISPDPREL